MLYQQLQSEALDQLTSNPLVLQYYGGKRVLVTGGQGFIGSVVVGLLEGLGGEILTYPRKQFDLTDQGDVEAMYHLSHPVDLVIHLAGVCNGIAETSRTHGYSFYQNLQMGMNVIHKAWQFGISKIVVTGSVCAYPQFTAQPMNEQNLYQGLPEESNGAYGLAKRALHSMLDSYYYQYKYPSAYLLLGNVYGPKSDMSLKTSHVISALIRKFTDAINLKSDSVTLWGSGQATRDFTYVTDTARAVVLAGVYLDKPTPVNIASGSEIFISGLAQVIKKLTGFEGDVLLDISKPDGQSRRAFNLERAKKWMNFQAQVPLSTGLEAVLEWYRSEWEPNGINTPEVPIGHTL
jgi:GDP-L-fucose synthase